MLYVPVMLMWCEVVKNYVTNRPDLYEYYNYYYLETWKLEQYSNFYYTTNNTQIRCRKKQQQKVDLSNW